MSDAPAAVVLDRAELAWAAGFLDGEGSTMVHKDESRPGYLRLEIAVPQSGHGAGVPAVLLRFQKAVGGLSRIVGPEGRDIYKCVSSGRLEAMAIVALLWSQLCEVKRRQANEAIKTFLAQYESAAFVARTGRHAGRVFDLITPSAEDGLHAQQLEVAWAAGFMDGEGCFGIARAGKRLHGPDWYRVRASATQHGAPASYRRFFCDSNACSVVASSGMARLMTSNGSLRVTTTSRRCSGYSSRSLARSRLRRRSEPSRHFGRRFA